MNLTVNARDAMPTGGKLTIETSNVELDDGWVAAHHGARPGPHVMLAVTDTGTGMDKATQARIFEPFFTTKGPGKGTGLGLSTVFGIAQQCGGSVWVYSEPGQGTSFKVYFPRVEADLDQPGQSLPPLQLRGNETILLVEDEEQVRVVAHGILKRNGYQVVVARNAGEALLHCEQRSGDAVDLLLTDVVMPQMSGAEPGEAGRAAAAGDEGPLHVRLHRRQYRAPRDPRERPRVHPEAVHAGAPAAEGAGGAQQRDEGVRGSREPVPPLPSARPPRRA